VIEIPSSVSIRLPDEIAHKLENLASDIERSKTYIILKAIESYLQEYTDYLIALERLRDKDDEIISSDEMRERLALQD
jgi:predicted DNA-binding protein